MRSLSSLFVAILFILTCPVSAEDSIDSRLKVDLEKHKLTSEQLAQWLQNVLLMRGHPCKSVERMAGDVPRPEPKSKRNTVTIVNCSDADYFITVGIGRGWTIERIN